MTTNCSIITMQGLGNRLHLVRDDAFEFTGAHAAAACRMSSADGVLVHGAVDGEPHRCVIWNADGSPAELCGNGLRCLVRLGVEEGWLDSTGARVHSAAGPHEVRMEDDGRVTVSMPMPRHGTAAVGLCDHTDFELDGDVATYVHGGRRIELSLVSTGNPHAIVFVAHDEHATLLPIIGPELEHHAALPSGINVHLADALDGGLQLSSWERGVGPTSACATGATAAVAAAIARGLIRGGSSVHMPGGTLDVYFESDVAWNTGAADHVRRWTMSLEATDADPPIRT